MSGDKFGEKWKTLKLGAGFFSAKFLNLSAGLFRKYEKPSVIRIFFSDYRKEKSKSPRHLTFSDYLFYKKKKKNIKITSLFYFFLFFVRDADKFKKDFWITKKCRKKIEAIASI